MTKQPMNSNMTRAWRSLIMLILGIVLAFGGWMGNEVYSFNEKFVNKKDYIRDVDRIEKTIDKQTAELKLEFQEMRKYLNSIVLRGTSDHERRAVP